MGEALVYRQVPPFVLFGGLFILFTTQDGNWVLINYYVCKHTMGNGVIL